jgi:hypothetical protein
VAVAQILGSPAVAIIMLLFVVSITIHVRIGMAVIIEDLRVFGGPAGVEAASDGPRASRADAVRPIKSTRWLRQRGHFLGSLAI